MATYATVTTLGDFGPWVSKLVLDLPCEVGANDVSPAGFNVFCARRESAGGPVLMRRERGQANAHPSQGFVDVLAAYPCDERGDRVGRGTHVALEMGEVRVNKRIEGKISTSSFVVNDYRVTQLRELPGQSDPVTGLVFDECTGDVCPALAGWHEGVQEQEVDGIRLGYGYYEPASFSARSVGEKDDDKDVAAAERDARSADASAEPTAAADASAAGASAGKPVSPAPAPLIVWLHGAGEGGSEVGLAYQGNRVTALSGRKIQSHFGGAAWVLVPQCPTYWMDNGTERLGRVNESVYARPLKALVDEFMAARPGLVDTDRIVIGGLSNGGFMTVRMCLDYPGLWAAGIPVCAPFYEENQTPEAVAAIGRTPLWFVHSKGDELVNPRETSLPLYARLREAGAEVQMTYFDHVEDLTGVYREPDGRPLRTFNHGVWIHVYNDFCHTDLDGRNVIVDGEPVGVWEWAAGKRRP